MSGPSRAKPDAKHLPVYDGNLNTQHTATMPVTTTTVTRAATKRFELPSLDFKFASLTEGTDIPPPQPSPAEETIPEVKINDGRKMTIVTATGADNRTVNGHGTRTHQPPPPSPSHSMVRNLKRSPDDVPPSPTLSRPGSIRRLFSRNLLNTAYAHGEVDADHATVAGSITRPDSRSTGSIADERKSRRSSGWFRRLRSGPGSSADSSSGGDSPTSKRMTMVFEEEKKPAGPPPPMIPELGQLKSKVDLDEGSLGADLFKSIK